MDFRLQAGKQSWYITSHPSRPSLLPSMNTKNAVLQLPVKADRLSAKVSSHLALMPSSSHKPSQLSQWECNNIAVTITVFKQILTVD